MSFQIERGLFFLDFSDYHAILGVPVDAEIKDIRKRYLKIARRLHPDSYITENKQDEQLASQILSKLVNPAWEKLSQEKDRTEYGLLLKLKGQQAIQKKSSIEILSNLAKQLAVATNLDHFYQTSLRDLAAKQYEHLNQSAELTAQLSELNLVYLMRKESSGGLSLDEPKKTIYTGSNVPDSTQAPPRRAAPPPPSSQQSYREDLTAQYYRRAEEHTNKNNFAQAILELREALQLDPNNSQCHSLMGMVYLKQNQATMAKIHFNKALQINPNEPMALEGKQKLEQPVGKSGKTSGTTASSPKSAAKGNKPDDKSGGGLFGLFGGKKK
ncbi:MAG: DnaJ domain-containing protein [Kovacikia sp.]